MPRTTNDYRCTLAPLMSYLDNTEYPKETVFTQQRLLQLTPADILKWMNSRTFGMENPPRDANPCNARSTSIMYWKKAISSFMPHKSMTWNPARNEGNPTKSREINELIAYVKKKEVRRQGVATSARRPLTDGEFRQQQTLLRESPESGNVTRYGVPAFANFQSHLISRIDCASQWKKELFKPYDTFLEFAAKCQLSWAKNIHEEGDAPWQIMLGSRDPLFCVFIGLAIWLEFYLGQSQGLSSYVFDFSGDYRVPEGGDKTNDFVQKWLWQTYNSGKFVAKKDGPLGSHSICKYAAT